MAKKTQAEVIKELQNNPDIIILNNPLSAPKLVRKLGKGKEFQLNEVYAPKLFYDIVSRITPEHLKQFDEGKTTVTLNLSIKDFLKSVNAGNSKSLYSHVVSCIDLLQTTQVKWSDAEKDYGTTIITHYEHHKGTGNIELVLYKELVKKVVEVSQNEHFSFLKKHLYRLQNAQAIKLFPFFVSWRNRGLVENELEAFKKKFGYDTEGYSRFSNLQKYVIDPAINEINEKTELTITYKLLGDNLQGIRPRVTGIQFFIKENKVKGLPSERQENKKTVSSDENVTIVAENGSESADFQKYYEQVADFWGVEENVFMKTVVGKTEMDIQKAIDYTKEQVRAGKANRPAGVFIDALKNGYESAIALKQKMAAKAAEQQKAKIETQKVSEKSVADEKKLKRQAEYEKNKGVLFNLIKEDPLFLEELLEGIKNNNLINQYYNAQKTILENMQNAMMAGVIMSIGTSLRPLKFRNA
jgi:plasmid replication initiation protein